MLSLPTSSTKMHSSKEYTMGYFYTDAALFHADKRDKGMNSTTSEKGTDNKRNNSSAYNHEYYMKNKEKWQDNNKSGDAKFAEYQKGDSDFDDANYSEKNRLGDTDFFGFQKPDGSWVILEEDMKWTLPAGMDRAAMIKALEAFDKEVETRRQNGENFAGDDWQKAANKAINSASKKKSSDSGEKEFDVDAAAMDVIRGKYGNGAERKAALGEDYAEVQKRVNELMKQQKSSSTSKSENKKTEEKKTEKKYVRHAEVDMTNNDWRIYQGDLDYLAHHGIRGQKWGVRRFENADGSLTAAGKARYGSGADKVEKYSMKATGWENRAINAKTGIGRGISTSMASSRRMKADRLAEKAEGDYKFSAFNKNHARRLRASSEVDAAVAKGLKERSENSTFKLKQKYLMEKAIKSLAGANNKETFGAKYAAVADAKVGKKAQTYIIKTLQQSSYTNAGRKRNFTTSTAESIGNQIIATAMKGKFNKNTERIEGINNKAARAAARVGNNVASNFVAGGAVTRGRDVHYRVKNSQDKRWKAMAR